MGNSQGKSEKDNLGTQTLESPYVKKILEAREKYTGWERVKMIFNVDEFSRISPELQRIITGTCIAVIVGACIGGMGRGRIAYSNFFRGNLHEKFETPLEARRKLQDSVTLGMFDGGYRIAWRVGLFTGMYMTVATAVSTYRGKMGVLDQVVGAGTAGFLYKFPQGPKASVSGVVFGSLLGLSAGVMTLGVTKLTGHTIDTANLAYYHNLAKKENKEVESVKAQREVLQRYDRREGDDDLELGQFHDKLIAALNETEEPVIGVDSLSKIPDASAKQVVVNKISESSNSNILDHVNKGSISVQEAEKT